MDSLITAIVSPTTLTTPLLALPLIMGFMYSQTKKTDKNTKATRESSKMVCECLHEVSTVLSLLIATEPEDVKRQMGQLALEQISTNLHNLEKDNEDTN